MDKKLLLQDLNGAGKTTFASEFLPNEAGCPIFINAEVAMKRAAIKARTLAQISGTAIVTMKDGVINEEYPCHATQSVAL
jgi:predicted ABC-type ATPase